MSRDVDDLLNQPTPTAAIRRDRYGRYLIPDPDTGRERPWTRATTLAGTLADRYGLEQWDQRNLALGLAARHDLYLRVASCTPEDKGELNKIVAEAKEAAKSKAGANIGTALHRFTERIDIGEPVSPPPPYDRDIDAYTGAMTAAGVTIVPGWLERILVLPDLGIAGTCDRLCQSPAWPLPQIADLKTGKDVVRYGMVEIALQLALYAHATYWWHPETGHHPMPDVDRRHALVMHLPAGQGACTLYQVDIAAGWEAVQLAVAVREWRKRKDIAEIVPAWQPVEPQGEVPPLTVVRDEALEQRVRWLRGRIAALTPSARLEASKTWPDAPRKAADITGHDQIDRISKCLWAVEQAHGLAFPDPDPNDDEPPAPVPEEPPVPPEPEPEAVGWADRGKALLALLDDEPLARACAQVAGCDNTRMTQLLYEQLQAVVTQVGDPAGAIRAMWHGADPAITVVDQAEQILAQAHGGTKTAALTAARRAARHHQLTIPKSLHDAATDPLLAALVASRTNTNNPQEDNQ